jgi:DUF4097 and DUF4098 domain-containing protein YvlB
VRRAAAFLALLTTAGCVAEEASRTEQFDFPAEAPVRVVVRSDDGPIEIRGASSPEVRVRVERRARGPHRRAAEELLEDVEVSARQEGGTVEVVVRSRHRPRVRVGGAWAVVEIRAPRKTNLDLDTRDGRIEIEGLEGDIRAATGDGRISLFDLNGRLRIRTRDGPIRGERLSGQLDAATQDGSIELAGAFSHLRAVSSDGRIKVHCNRAVWLTDDWLIRSGDGRIELTVPRDLSADISASTDDGRISSDLDLLQAKKSSTRLRGRLGEGGRTILIRTGDGSIRLRAE